MAVNRKVYDSINLAPSNASAQALVDQLRQMLIDQGFMTDWHDSWVVANNRSGNNYFRVLKLTQDAAKTYGSTYLIFCGSYEAYDSRLKLSVAITTGGWNSTSHVSTGTQYLDYFFNPDGNWVWNSYPRVLFEISNTSRNLRLISYKSGNSLAFWYPSLTGIYVIQSSIDSQPSWLDLDKVCLPPFFGLGGGVGNYGNGYRCLYWYWPYVIRRMVFPGRTASGTSTNYFNTRLITMTYMYQGFGVEINMWSDVLDPNSADYSSPSWGGAIRLPWGDGANLPASSSPWCPLVTNVDMALPLNLQLPSDFCIATIPSQTKSATAPGRITVSPTEVWEIAGIVATPNAPNSMVFMARIV